MNKTGNSFIKKEIFSIKNALKGIKVFFVEERHARIHAVAALAVVVLGIAAGISKFEWIAILVCIALVMVTEIVNSAIENLCDFVSPEKHALIRKTKDLAAGAVLVCAILSIIIAGIVFLPKLIA